MRMLHFLNYLKPNRIKSRIIHLFGYQDIEILELYSSLITFVIGVVLLLLPTLIPYDIHNIIPNSITPLIADLLGVVFICLSSIKLAALMTSNHISLRKNISLVLALAYVWLTIQFLCSPWHRLFLLLFLPLFISDIWIYIRLLKLHVNVLRHKSHGSNPRTNI